MATVEAAQDVMADFMLWRPIPRRVKGDSDGGIAMIRMHRSGRLRTRRAPAPGNVTNRE